MNDSPDILRITTDEVAAVVPAPARPGSGRESRVASPTPRSTGHQLAATALVLAILGIVLVGCLLGPIAMVLAVFALVNAERDERPTRLAYAALGLGFVVFVGWAVVLWQLLSPKIGDKTTVPASLATTGAAVALRVGDAPPHILRALKANLRLACHDSGGMQQGAGVAIASDDSGHLVLTNRHVVDCVDRKASKLVANLFGGAEQPATVVWIAPSGVDLALVRVSGLTGAELIPVVPQRAQIGDAIFTVGNPLGYEASYSVGTLSAVRQAHFGNRAVRVYQVQAAINPGNSGGGLYAANGQLLGINTWVANQQIAEGIGFALAIDDVVEVLRQSTPLWQEIERTPAEQKGSAP